MRRTVFILASCCLAAGLGYAQESHSLVDTLVKHWETSKAFSEAVLEAMPDGGYSYKATEAEMGFGEMANQVADANGHYCSAALGTQSPIAQSTDFSKAAVSKKLAASYDFCIDGLKKLSDQDLMKQAGPAGRQSTEFELFWGAFTHAAHHRGQLEVYLRLKGIKPPNYKF